VFKQKREVSGSPSVYRLLPTKERDLESKPAVRMFRMPQESKFKNAAQILPILALVQGPAAMSRAGIRNLPAFAESHGFYSWDSIATVPVN